MTFKKPVILLIFLILFCVNVQASQPLESNTPNTNLDYDSIIDDYLDDFDLRPSRKETLKRMIESQTDKAITDFQHCQDDFLRIVFTIANTLKFTEEETVQYFAMMSAESGCSAWKNKNQRIGLISSDNLFKGIGQIGPVWYNTVVLSRESKLKNTKYLESIFKETDLLTINEDIKRNKYGSTFGGQNNIIDSDSEYRELARAIKENKNPYASALMGAVIYKNIIKVIESESANSNKPFELNKILSNWYNLLQTHHHSVDLFYATCFSYKYTSMPIKFRFGITSYDGKVSNNADLQIAVKMANYLVLKEVLSTQKYDNTTLKDKIIANYTTYYKSTYRMRCLSGEYDSSLLAETVGDLEKPGLGGSVSITVYPNDNNFLLRMCPLPETKTIIVPEKRLSNSDILKYDCVIDQTNKNCNGLYIPRPFLCSKVAVDTARNIFGLNYIKTNAWDLIYENNVIWEKESNLPLTLVPGVILGIYIPTSDYLYRVNDNSINNLELVKKKDMVGREREYTHVALYLGNISSRDQILHMVGKKVGLENLDEYLTFQQGILQDRITLFSEEEYKTIEKNNILYWVSTKKCYSCFDGYYCEFKDIDNSFVVYDKLCNPNNKEYDKFRPLYECCKKGLCDCNTSVSRVLYPNYTKVNTLEELYTGYNNLN